MLLGGFRLIPGIFLGALLANALTGIGVVASFAIATGNSAEAVIALLILWAISPFKNVLGEYTRPAWLVASSVLAPLLAATIGTSSIAYLALGPLRRYPTGSG